MAKIKMMCPFSSKPCRDCAFYRGRHYFLCFSEDYGGHVDEQGQVTNVSESLASGMRSGKKFEMPRILPTKAYDLFAETPKDIKKEA